jgi:predicted nucleic acid-binding protein
MRNKIAIADADSLIALALEEDLNHRKAIDIATKFIEEGIEVVFPVTVFPEAITSLVRAANQPEKAHMINRQLSQGAFHIEYMDDEIIKNASKIFEDSKSKKNTMFDAIVAATANKLKTNMIFSFDNWYPKLGFELAGTK